MKPIRGLSSFDDPDGDLDFDMAFGSWEGDGDLIIGYPDEDGDLIMSTPSGSFPCSAEAANTAEANPSTSVPLVNNNGGNPVARNIPDTLVIGLSSWQIRHVRSKALAQCKEVIKVAKASVKLKWAATVRSSGLIHDPRAGRPGSYTIDSSHPWSTIHPSHSTRVAGGLAFCTKCGKTSSSQPKLKARCMGHPVKPNATRVINNLLKGRVPDIRS